MVDAARSKKIRYVSEKGLHQRFSFRPDELVFLHQKDGSVIQGHLFYSFRAGDSLIASKGIEGSVFGNNSNDGFLVCREGERAVPIRNGDVISLSAKREGEFEYFGGKKYFVRTYEFRFSNPKKVMPVLRNLVDRRLGTIRKRYDLDSKKRR